jgi:AraC-like DNA-binding protein
MDRIMGYCSSSTFGVAFTRQVGASPTTYARDMRAIGAHAASARA